MSHTNHFVAKHLITRSLIEGVRVQAICGELVLCTPQGEAAISTGSVGRKNTPICIACQLLFMSLPAEEASEKEGDAHRQRHCVETS